MSDTPRHIFEMWSADYAARTAAERVRMAATMFKSAITLAKAGIKASQPGLTEVELRRQLLHRLYAGELTPAQVESIARSLVP